MTKPERIQWLNQLFDSQLAALCHKAACYQECLNMSREERICRLADVEWIEVPNETSK